MEWIDTIILLKEGKVKYWLRIGDNAPYYSYARIEKAGARLAEENTGKRLIQWVKWVSGGCELSSVFIKRNYVSFYLGDNEGNYIRDLSEGEKDIVEYRLKEEAEFRSERRGV